MKTLIYQYWDGTLKSGNEAGSKMMKKYAETISADYIFELNPRWKTDLGKYSPYYGCFKPIFDKEMSQYDYVLFADTDVIPIENLRENIFDQFINTDVEIGICEEWNQPAQRALNEGYISNINDNLWCSIIESKYPHAKMARTKEGWPKVFNSGVVVYSNKGMQKFRETYIEFKDYVKWISEAKLPGFYECDQPYLHAMLEIGKFNWTIIDYKWNSSVHHKSIPNRKEKVINDLRNNRANFVHIQLQGADNYDYEKTWRVANLPVKDWKI